jgi:hypothetical protein
MRTRKRQAVTCDNLQEEVMLAEARKMPSRKLEPLERPSSVPDLMILCEILSQGPCNFTRRSIRHLNQRRSIADELCTQ